MSTFRCHVSAGISTGQLVFTKHQHRTEYCIYYNIHLTQCKYSNVTLFQMHHIISSSLRWSRACLCVLTMRNMALRCARIELPGAVGTLNIVWVLGGGWWWQVGKITPGVLNLRHFLRIAYRIDETFMLGSPVTLLRL